MSKYAKLEAMGVMGGRQYWQKTLNVIGRTNVVAAWYLNESSGTVVYDRSGNGRNGTYPVSGITYRNPSIGFKQLCTGFDGSAGYANIYSSSFASAFNGAEGTILLFFKVGGASIWTDGASHQLIRIFKDTSNYIYAGKSTTNGQIIFRYASGGTAKAINYASSSQTTPLHIAITWSKSGDAFAGYINFAQIGTTQTGLGTWSGTPASTGCLIGASAATPSDPWNGWLSGCFIASRALSSAEIAKLSVPLT